MRIPHLGHPNYDRHDRRRPQGGPRLQRDYGELANLQVSQKAPGDYVTAADKRCDKILREELAKVRPGYSFLTEETGTVKGTDPDHRFIIDPIDGTMNFMHSVPLFAITMALERKDELVAAITYNPITDEMFTAEKGGGAFLNNKRLRVAQRRDIHETLVSYEMPHRGGKDLPLSRAEISRAAGRASSASAARARRPCRSAYVAAGRFDAMVCRNIQSHGTSRPASCWCARPAASSPTPTARRTRWRPATSSPPMPICCRSSRTRWKDAPNCHEEFRDEHMTDASLEIRRQAGQGLCQEEVLARRGGQGLPRPDRAAREVAQRHGGRSARRRRSPPRRPARSAG